MLIDWFTVGAQALNFLILVWLLKRYLYKPILDALDARERRIAAELADADAKKSEAQEERDLFLHKNEQFDEQRAALMNEAMEEVKAERRRLLDEARTAADALSAKRQEALRAEADNLNDAIRRKAQQEVFTIARKTLKDLAAVSLEERMTEMFVQQVRTMKGGTKETLAQTLEAASEPVLVRSAYGLSGAQRATIEQALTETFSADIPLRFETAPSLVSGIELITNGQKIAWSIADYLTAMEKVVGSLHQDKDLVDAATGPPTTPKAGPKADKPKPETQRQ